MFFGGLALGALLLAVMPLFSFGLNDKATHRLSVGAAGSFSGISTLITVSGIFAESTKTA